MSSQYIKTKKSSTSRELRRLPLSILSSKRARNPIKKTGNKC